MNSLKNVIFFLLFYLPTQAQSQQNESNFWRESNSKIELKIGEHSSIIKKYRSLTLDFSLMTNRLDQALNENILISYTVGPIIYLPMPDGTFSRFRVVNSPIMPDLLSIQFPKIKTFTAKGIDIPTAVAKLDYTQFGFHAMIVTPDGWIFIDPAHLGNTSDYICYNRRDGQSYEPLFCNTENLFYTPKYTPPSTYNLLISSGNQLKTYRLAIACTGEYAAVFGGTTTGAMSAIVTTINRVSGIYELELAVRLNLISNNNLLIYTDASTDPYTNNDGSTMLNENRNNIGNIIGSSNYDIGHVFSTGGGGIAGLGVVCNSFFNFKAKGVTGSSTPFGDSYDIDYVAHEIGHQFGGNHTFNSVTGSCGGGNRNSSTAYEPGSGTTIMGYAGICGIDDIQLHSDPIFQTGSFDEIQDYITTGNGNSCPATSSTGNTAPAVNVGSNYKIPISTPFKLTGSATDANGDPLTYLWEQFDHGTEGSPNNPSGNAPIFRDWTPSSFNYRYFPRMEDLVLNQQTMGEILPSYARSLNFRLTARDNHSGGGGVSHNDIPVTLTVVNTSTPFKVTSPNSNLIWYSNSTQSVTWDVSSTNISPINCTQVNILLSTDNGYTYPYTLVSNTPNDGNETITVPNITSSTARIKVESVGNIFFDISNVNFTIAMGCIDNFESNNSCNSATPVFANPLGTGTSNYSIDANIGYAGDQDWYSFQLASCGTLTISLSNLPLNYDMELYGTCGGLALQGQYHLNTDNEQIVLNNTSPGTNTYRIKIYSANSANSSIASCYHLNFQWASSSCACSSSNTQAANTCPTATLINPTSSCNYLSYTSCGATNSAINLCSGNQDDDVWLYFNATQPSYSINVLGNLDYDAAFQILEQDQVTGICGGSMPSVTCQNINGIGQLESTTISTTIGKKYFIRVWHAGTGAGSTGNFQICVFNSCPSPPVPTATIASNVSQTGFQANWNQVAGATKYLLDVATNASFTNFVSGYSNLDVGNVNSVSISGLACNTSYYYRIKSFNSSCSSNNSNTIQVATSACQVSAPNLLCQSGTLIVNGNIIDASVTIANNGTSSAINTVILLKLFSDLSLTQEVAVIGVQTISFLQAGFTATTPNAQYNLCAAGIPDGTYYLAYYIDYYNNIPELNENDNGWCSVSPVQLIANCCTNPNPPTSQFGSLSCPGTALYNQTSITLSWSNAGPYNYDVELLEYPFDANSIIFSQSCIQAQSVVVPNALLSGHLYAWRIRTTTDCSTCNGNYSPLYYFHLVPSISPLGPISICDGSNVILTTDAIFPTSSTTIFYQWYKGLGTNATPVGTNASSYVVGTSGTYSVKLTYNGSSICSGQVVSQSLDVNITIANTPSIPILSYNSPVCSGSNLVLTSTGPNSAQYYWTGPNGYAATGKTITINSVDQAYAGIYSCYYLDNFCQSTTSTLNVFISPPASANFTYSVQGSTANFINNSSNASSYNWNFGDGQSSTQTNPSHNYISNNSYNVCLTANAQGCNSGSSCQSISFGNIIEPTQPTFARLYHDSIIEHITWDCFDFVQSTVDSGYIILGLYQENSNSTSTTQYFKIDKNGKVVWVRELPANFNSAVGQIIKSHNGYLISTYYGNACNLFEIDEQGNKLWGKQYANSCLSKIIKIATGGYAGLGSMNAGIELFNIDNSGNIIWKKGFQYNLFSSTNVNFRNFIQSTSGDYYITGVISNNQLSGTTGWDGILIKINSVGTHVWSKYYNSGTNLRDDFSGIIEDANQNIIVSGLSTNTSIGGFDGLLFKTDPLGTIISSYKTIQTTTSRLRRTPTNQIVALYSNGTTAVEFNSNLSVINQKHISISGTENFNCTFDNKFAIVSQYLIDPGNNQYRYGFFKFSFADSSCLDAAVPTISTTPFSINLISTTPILTVPTTVASNFSINPLVSSLKDTSLCPICIPEICGNAIDDDCDGIIDENCSVNFQLSAFIEGYYLGNNLMRAAINPILYPSVCDTIIIELRTTVSPFNIIYKDTGLLSTSGIGELLFPIGILNNSYYIVFRHRNGLETWSSAPVYFGSNNMTYSFKNALINAYGNNLRDLNDGNFAILSGDINQDGMIDQIDFNEIESTTQSFLSGYVSQDLTGDWIIESSDFSLIENNLGKLLLRP